MVRRSSHAPKRESKDLALRGAYDNAWDEANANELHAYMDFTVVR
jgi:hypothetical protein